MIAVTIIDGIRIELKMTSYSVAFRFSVVRSEHTCSSREKVIT